MAFLVKRRPAPPLVAACLLPLALAQGSELQAIPAQAVERGWPERVKAVRACIQSGWATLTRSTGDLPEAARDPKLELPEGRRFPVYLSPGEEKARVERELRQSLGPERFATIELRVLPASGKLVREHGLLYLPRPYVVPDGRFNEMYG